MENDNKDWLSRNSIAKNEIYIRTLLQDIKFDKYQIITDGYGDCSLIITQAMEDYRVEIDSDKAQFKIFMRNKANNFKQKERYRFIRLFECGGIYEVLTYIKDKCGKKYDLVC